MELLQIRTNIKINYLELLQKCEQKYLPPYFLSFLFSIRSLINNNNILLELEFRDLKTLFNAEYACIDPEFFIITDSI